MKLLKYILIMFLSMTTICCYAGVYTLIIKNADWQGYFYLKPNISDSVYINNVEGNANARGNYMQLLMKNTEYTIIINTNDDNNLSVGYGRTDELGGEVTIENGKTMSADGCPEDEGSSISFAQQLIA